MYTYDYEILHTYPKGAKEVFSFLQASTYSGKAFAPVGDAGYPGRVFIDELPFSVVLLHRDCNTVSRITPEREFHWALGQPNASRVMPIIHQQFHTGRNLSEKKWGEFIPISRTALHTETTMYKPGYKLNDLGKLDALQPFEIVAVDESGVVSPMGFDGSNYYVVFVCIRTMFHDVYTMAAKDEFSTVLELYIRTVRQRGFRTSQMVLRMDNAGEHISATTRDILLTHEVTPSFTIPYYHHQNPAEIAIREVSESHIGT